MIRGFRDIWRLACRGTTSQVWSPPLASYSRPSSSGRAQLNHKSTIFADNNMSTKVCGTLQFFQVRNTTQPQARIASSRPEYPSNPVQLGYPKNLMIQPIAKYKLETTHDHTEKMGNFFDVTGLMLPQTQNGNYNYWA